MRWREHLDGWQEAGGWRAVCDGMQCYCVLLGAGVTRWRLIISDGQRAASAARLCAQHTVSCVRWTTALCDHVTQVGGQAHRVCLYDACATARTPGGPMRVCAHSSSNPHACTERVGNLGRGMPRETRRFLVAKTHRTIPARHSRRGRGLSVGGSGVGVGGGPPAAVAPRPNSSSSSSSAQAYSCVVAHKTSMVSASSLNCLRAGSDMALAFNRRTWGPDSRAADKLLLFGLIGRVDSNA